ncbi:MAG: hypothetical protein ACD_79C00220G0001 [uncultured bacterium]|nr:MAG: hypothetical protein ACD_79C00220G0001 [uncultured bacterium]
MEVLLLFSFLPNLKVFSLGKVLKDFPFFRGFLNSLYLIKKRANKNYTLKRLFAKTKKYKRRIHFVCLFIQSDFTQEDINNFLNNPACEKYPAPIYLNVKRRGRVIFYNFVPSLDQNA